MDCKQIAKDLFHAHYMILFDCECDCSQEVLISLLARKHALETLKFMNLSENDYLLIKSELDKL